MRREVNLDPKSTFGFLGSADVVVLYVGPLASLNEAVASHFETFGHVDDQHFNAFARSSELVMALVDNYRRRAGWSSGSGLPSGYYLFLDRTIRGYEPGTPTSPEVVDRIIRYFDRQITRFRRYPYLLGLPITPDTDALEWLLDGTPSEMRRSVADCIAIYEAGRKAGIR
jgi:hypothetical protein